MNEKEQQAAVSKISQEMRRGILILATLSQLKEERYGYALIDQLSQQGLDIDQGTLYPLLRRLESQGLLDSNWILSGSRPRRYYRINPAGEAVLKGLTQEWNAITGVMATLLKKAE
ncbi:MAG: helix-turn-helix transcriptional regulator [Anaerolineales bacterium]|nr:helix-turn-helix transcriptional regulator [Anaerolineales bacterium]